MERAALAALERSAFGMETLTPSPRSGTRNAAPAGRFAHAKLPLSRNAAPNGVRFASRPFASAKLPSNLYHATTFVLLSNGIV